MRVFETFFFGLEPCASLMQTKDCIGFCTNCFGMGAQSFSHCNFLSFMDVWPHKIWFAIVCIHVDSKSVRFMYSCIHACMHVCMYACMHVCMYACLYVCGRSVVSTVSNLQCCCCCSMNAYPAPIPCLAWPLTSKMPGMDPAKETVLICPGLVYPNLGFQACWKKINKICWKKTCLAVFFAPPVEIVD